MDNLEIEEVQPLNVDLDSPRTIQRKRNIPIVAMIVFGLVLILCVVALILNYEDSETEQTLANLGIEVTKEKTQHPTPSPTINPTTQPTKKPSKIPTIAPTPMPSPNSITINPTIKANPKDKISHKAVTKLDGIMYTTIGETLYHNRTHFTQGLTYSKSSNILFESNGLYRESNLCRLDPETGHELLCKNMDQKDFAEGMQVYGHGYDEKLIQLTWKSKKGYIYNATTLEKLSQFKFHTKKDQGWGICLDEKKNEFIVSDGSDTLHFWDVDTLEEKRRVEVKRYGGSQAMNINELEFVKGKVLANVWFEDVVLVINPETGECESEYNFRDLWPPSERRRDHADVLNGISISKDDGVIYITGKKWNRMYKVTLNGF